MIVAVISYTERYDETTENRDSYNSSDQTYDTEVCDKKINLTYNFFIGTIVKEILHCP